MRLNKKLAALALAITTAISSFGAQAQTAEVKVTGTIVPGSCTPTLTGGGVIDLGTIGAAEVSQTDFNMRPQQTTTFSIVCNAPTKVGLRGIDNQAASVVPSVLTKIGSSWTDDYNYGLGSMKGKKTGGYNILFVQDSYTADSAKVKTIWSNSTGVAWQNGSSLGKGAKYMVSWSSATGPAIPVAFESISGTLSVQAVLNKGSELTLTDDVDIDGSATIELVYL